MAESPSQSRLRASVDGNDLYVGSSFDQRQRTGRAGHRARLHFAQQREPWAFDDEQVRLLVSTVFPNISTNPTHHKRAGLWGMVIVMYWRKGAPAAEIAAQQLPAYPRRTWKTRLVKKTKSVEATIRRIRAAAAGLRTDGTARVGKMGRPKSIVGIPEKC